MQNFFSIYQKKKKKCVVYVRRLPMCIYTTMYVYVLVYV